MKNLLFILLLMISACTAPVEKPKNLIPPEKMSELIAEFAMSDQLNSIAPKASSETQTRFILKEQHIKAKDFKDSYTFYTATNQLNDIFDNAEKIILKKDPKAEDYINKELKKTQLLPALGR